MLLSMHKIWLTFRKKGEEYVPFLMKKHIMFLLTILKPYNQLLIIREIITMMYLVLRLWKRVIF